MSRSVITSLDFKFLRGAMQSLSTTFRIALALFVFDAVVVDPSFKLEIGQYYTWRRVHLLLVLLQVLNGYTSTLTSTS